MKQRKSRKIENTCVQRTFRLLKKIYERSISRRWNRKIGIENPCTNVIEIFQLIATKIRYEILLFVFLETVDRIFQLRQLVGVSKSGTLSTEPW